MSQTHVNQGVGAMDGGVTRRARWSGATMTMVIVGAVLILALALYAVYAAGVFRSAPTPNTPATQSGQTGSSGATGGTTGGTSGSTTGGTSGGSSAPSGPAPRVPGY